SNAERIRGLAALTSDLARRMSDDAGRFGADVANAIEQVKRSLARPGGKFDEAREQWQRYRPRRNPLEDYAAEVGAYRNELDSCRTIFAETDKFDGARAIIDRILKEAADINNLYGECAKADAVYKALADAVDDYEQKYPRYCELLKQFKREGNMSVKRRIVQQIQDEDLTCEELPVVELAELIPVRLHATVEKVKTGLFRSKKVLKVKVELPDGVSLPCNSVLLIQERPLASVQDKYIRAEYDKGEEGSFEFSADLPLAQCDGASRLRVYFKPHPDEAIGINNAFECNECNVEL
ncbi:MAG: hypothetical protein K2L80_07645, partial [Muribaculaceae bacterium]|nr:hypothetical protein [Muribaculaceae bacterium]